MPAPAEPHPDKELDPVDLLAIELPGAHVSAPGTRGGDGAQGSGFSALLA